MPHDDSKPRFPVRHNAVHPFVRRLSEERAIDRNWQVLLLCFGSDPIHSSGSLFEITQIPVQIVVDTRNPVCD
ncbi:hypothetical protein VT03_11120 [Planctomyces sp. SH-PL14]|nr:hypothetical protein VT03_11120 [Planctomyces sp. SH-PL14]